MSLCVITIKHGLIASERVGYLVVLSPSEMTVMLSQNLKYLVPVSVLSDERNDLIGEK